MTPDELKTLTYFRDGERYLNNTQVDWSTIDYHTMQCVELLRQYLDEPIILIRGAHPNRPSAIDACCPKKPLSAVFLALTRLQYASWGIYSGGSFHIDVRTFHGYPARWAGIKIEEEGILKDRGLACLEAYRANGWIYLLYNHDLSLDGINLVCELSGKRCG